MEGENLSEDSLVRIVSLSSVHNPGEPTVLEKSQYVRLFEDFLPDFEYNSLGKKLRVSDIESRVSEIFNAQNDRLSRACYSLPDFASPQEDYISIKRLGRTQESSGKTAERNLFMYLRHDIGKNTLSMGFFELDTTGQAHIVVNKKDYIAILFD